MHSQEELALLAAYRALDVDSRQSVLAYARFEASLAVANQNRANLALIYSDGVPLIRELRFSHIEDSGSPSIGKLSKDSEKFGNRT